MILQQKLEALPNAARIHRDEVAGFVLRHPETFPELFSLVFSNSGKLSVKAAWVLELVCFKNISLLIPFLDEFTDTIHQISDESALRPLSKIINLLVKNQLLNASQKEKCVDTCFDWIIEPHKIATQVFAMDSLFLLGTDFPWIHPELKDILSRELTRRPAGYQNRAKKILNKISY